MLLCSYVVRVGCSRCGGGRGVTASVASDECGYKQQLKVNSLDSQCMPDSQYKYEFVIVVLCSVLQSFEEIVSQYAQQLSLNTNETISVPSLTIVAELVC